MDVAPSSVPSGPDAVPVPPARFAVGRGPGLNPRPGWPIP